MRINNKEVYFMDLSLVVPCFNEEENIIEFYVMNKSEECLRGSFDMTTGVYTPIKEFVMW